MPPGRWIVQPLGVVLRFWLPGGCGVLRIEHKNACCVRCLQHSTAQHRRLQSATQRYHQGVWCAAWLPAPGTPGTPGTQCEAAAAAAAAVVAPGAWRCVCVLRMWCLANTGYLHTVPYIVCSIFLGLGRVWRRDTRRPHHTACAYYHAECKRLRLDWEVEAGTTVLQTAFGRWLSITSAGLRGRCLQKAAAAALHWLVLCVSCGVLSSSRHLANSAAHGSRAPSRDDATTFVCY